METVHFYKIDNVKTIRIIIAFKSNLDHSSVNAAF